MNNVLKFFLLMIICVALMLLVACKKTTNEGLSDNMALKIINSIVKIYGSKKASSKLLNKEELSVLDRSGNIEHKIVSDIKTGEFVLGISFMAKDKNSRINPNEIYVIFECFLTLKEKNKLDNIAAIKCSYNSGEAFDDDTWWSLISYKEFEFLYNDIYADGKKNNELAKELGDRWINKHHYYRPRLELDKDDEYRELLISPFSPNKLSYDKKFSAGYYYKCNELSIDKITISKVNDKYVMSSTQTLIKNPINETGFLYGAWDEQKNIWLYGEDIGIRLYKFDGDKNWEQADYTDENQIPYVLKKVLETKG